MYICICKFIPLQNSHPYNQKKEQLNRLSYPNGFPVINFPCTSQPRLGSKRSSERNGFSCDDDRVVVVVAVVVVVVVAGGVAGGGGAAGGGGSDVDVDVVFLITGHPRILDWGIEVWRVLGVLLGLPVLERCQVKGVPPVLTRLNWIMIVRTWTNISNTIKLCK